MDDSRYNIIYKGEICKGNEIERVKKNLAGLFNINEKKIGQFFIGKPVVIKKNVDYNTAVKYAKTLKNAGAVCKISKIKPASEQKKSSRADKPNALSKNRPAKKAINKSENLSGRHPQHQEKKIKEPEAMMTCPKCSHEQPKAETCPYCGTVIKKYLKSGAASRINPSVQTRNKFQEQQQTRKQPHAPDIQADNGQDSFLATLCRANADEGVEVRRIIKWAAIAGAVAGLIWGGIFDPWQRGGFIASVLNCFIFGACGIIGAISMLGARNFGYVNKRSGLMLVCFVCCGAWLSIFFMLNSFFDPSSAPSTFLIALFKLGYGFFTGGFVSILCVSKLSSEMIEDDSLDKPLVAIFCLLIVGNILYVFMKPGPDGITLKFNTETSIYNMNVEKNTLLALGSSGYIYAVNRESGDRIWRLQRGTDIRRHVMAEENTLFFVSSGPKKHYINAVEIDSGNEIWKLELAFKAEQSAFSDEMAVIRDSLGDFHVVDLNAHEVINQWEFEKSLTAAIPPPGLSGKEIYCIGEDGSLVATDADDGSRLWDFSSEADTFHADMVVNKEIIYFPAGKNIIAISKDGGFEEWRYQADEDILNLVFEDGILYFGTRARLYALNTDTATILWKYGKKISMSLIVTDNDMLYAVGTDKNPKLYAVNKITGKEKWIRKLDLSPSALTAQDNIVYVAGTSSDSKFFIYAIDPKAVGK
ncbi:PQQ-binding-like beta-propeller repeat protein [Desulfobacterales bacterium HSG16]|nr:PQQ-binding-like beta-propeller repeat protein [Desulfobacterales bacterium HSG16]